jgi:molybdopterin converting factor subunit 1
MKIEILFFGAAHDLAGTRRMDLDVPSEMDTASLKIMLQERFQGINSELRYALAVNQQVVAHNQVLNEGDVVAVLPPVSGG